MGPLLKTAAFLFLWSLSANTQCADIFFGEGRNNPEIRIDGPISIGDDERLLRVIQDDPTTFLRSGRISINSPGGDVETAIKLAKLIEESGLNLNVRNGDVCASACFLIYVSAPIKVARPGSRVIVHRPYYDMTNAHGSTQGTLAEAYQRTNLQIRDYLIARAVPDILINKMMQTPSSQGYVLTIDDLISLHLMNAPVQEYAIQKCGYTSYTAPGSLDCIKNYLMDAKLAFIARYVKGEESSSIENSTKEMEEFISWLDLMKSTDPNSEEKIEIVTKAMNSEQELDQTKRIQLFKAYYHSLGQDSLPRLNKPYD